MSKIGWSLNFNSNTNQSLVPRRVNPVDHILFPKKGHWPHAKRLAQRWIEHLTLASEWLQCHALPAELSGQKSLQKAFPEFMNRVSLCHDSTWYCPARDCNPHCQLPPTPICWHQGTHLLALTSTNSYWLPPTGTNSYHLALTCTWLFNNTSTSQILFIDILLQLVPRKTL